MIESDPEDDLIEQASRPKYSRGPEMSNTPTYSMDTDISTLEAPTFSTLNQGPSQTMMMLRWDHQINLLGKKVSYDLSDTEYRQKKVKCAPILGNQSNFTRL